MSEDAELRVVRVALPVQLIRRMDELLTREVAGYRTRAELVREAVEALTLELKYEDAPPELRSPEGRPHEAPQELLTRKPPDENLTPHIEPLGSETPILVSEPAGTVDAEPLLGLHNRDYPSIWAARHLASMTSSELVRAEEFNADVLAAAWRYGELLGTLEKKLGKRISSLFPTNRDKAQSASSAFLAFAIGSHTNSGGALHTAGPLFNWGVAQFQYVRDNLCIGLTERGVFLLKELGGLPVDQPHRCDYANSFLSYLEQYVPNDWWGFTVVLSAAASGASRDDLVQKFQSERRDWTPNVSSTNAAGYVARAREWGLLEEKQVRGCYRLTNFGKEYLEGFERGLS